MTQAAIISLIVYYSSVYGVDQKVAIAVAEQESSMNPNAIGKQHEIGLFQIKAEYTNYTKKELFKPEVNILVGIQKLKEARDTCFHRANLDWLTCYNIGRTAAKKIKHPSKFPYVKAVKKKIMVASNE